MATHGSKGGHESKSKHEAKGRRGAKPKRATHEAEAESHTTTDHETIRRWVEARQGQPATVKSTGSKQEPGLLRIDFPGGTGSDRLEPISWDDFFAKFEEKQLAFLYQEQLKGGEISRFFKLVRRDQPTKH
jgi:hypothetical protein